MNKTKRLLLTASMVLAAIGCGEHSLYDDVFGGVSSSSEESSSSSSSEVPSSSSSGLTLDTGEESEDSVEDNPTQIETGRPAESKTGTGWKYVPGTYLTTSKWGQREPYNSKWSAKVGDNGSIGCVKTRNAQLMYYHKWPPRVLNIIPAKSIELNGVNVQIPALPPFDFDWDNMVDVYGGKGVTTTEAQKKAVAELYDAVASSGGALTFFDYDISAKTLYRKDFAQSEWEQIIKDQINQGLPVNYHARRFDANGNLVSGHGFIIDGYDASGKFHINMGFSNNGASSGFYDISSDDFRWPHEQKMTIDIKPIPLSHYNLKRAAIDGGTYVLEYDIDGDGKLPFTLDVKNDFTLDLNGHTLTIDISRAGDGIKIASGKRLTIKDSKSGGVLNINNAYLNYAGINTTDGTLIIESGTVNAKARRAGIGGGTNGSGGTIVINGGTVTAISETNGAGIGGGYGGDGGTITINGGSVTATGIDGAGIGGGYGGDGGTIIIRDGTVTATGSKYGAGIGGGRDGDGGTITISGGVVNAKGDAGIGGGRNSSGTKGNGGAITISDGTVSAIGNKNSAGIGGGSNGGNSGNITITGGTVNAKGGNNSDDPNVTTIGGGAGIGGGSGGNGGKITISGGTVEAIAGGTRAENIGKGYNGTSSGEIEIGEGAVIK